MGGTLKKNLTKLVYVWQERNPKLKIAMPLLFLGRK